MMAKRRKGVYQYREIGSNLHQRNQISGIETCENAVWQALAKNRSVVISSA